MTTRTSVAMRLGFALKGITIASGLALAATSAQGAETARLTPASVKRFIASFPEVKTLAISEGMTKGKKIGSSENALLAVVEAASDDTLKGELDTTARRHGFRDGKEWFGVARSVGVAYAHMKAGSVDEAKAQKKLEKAISKIEDMPLLSDKQKKKMIEELRKGAGKVLEQPSAENMEVVKAMAPQIEAVVK